MAGSPGVLERLEQVERDVADLERAVVQFAEVLVVLTDRLERRLDQLGELERRVNRLEKRWK